MAAMAQAQLKKMTDSNMPDETCTLSSSGKLLHPAESCSTLLPYMAFAASYCANVLVTPSGCLTLCSGLWGGRRGGS